MNPFDGAKCVGLHWLFDSTDRRDHIEARALCQECPARLACHQLLADVRAGSASARSGGSPSGTWAGRYIDRVGKERVVPNIHGTAYGYDRHRHNGEAACKPCLDAHAAKQRLRTARRRAS